MEITEWKEKSEELKFKLDCIGFDVINSSIHIMLEFEEKQHKFYNGDKSKYLRPMQTLWCLGMIYERDNFNDSIMETFNHAQSAIIDKMNFVIEKVDQDMLDAKCEKRYLEFAYKVLKINAKAVLEKIEKIKELKYELNKLYGMKFTVQ